MRFAVDGDPAVPDFQVPNFVWCAGSDHVKPLTKNDIEAELSYAYVHAVAAKAGMACQCAERSSDNNGIDAKLSAWGPFADSYLMEVDLKIQLKATVSLGLHAAGTHWSYFFDGVTQYDDLRSLAVATPRVLVVLRLPKDPEQWLECGDDALLLRHSAYWVSLRSAPATANASGVTLYIPKFQRFGPESLREIVKKVAVRDIPVYAGSP